ncbi:MAG: WD40 repeat domain-containing protein [Chloroflexota bacterium]
MRRLFLLLFAVLMIIIPLSAQDGLNLPSELYVLTTEGRVQRFGLGSEGVSTITPDEQFVLDFRVAPDANWLAYRTQEGLFMVNIFDEANNPRQIEDERASVPVIRGQGETISWSPDSSAIAYTTEYGGRVHFFREERFVDLTTPNLRNLLWSPDGAFLAAEADEDVWWVFQRVDTAMQLRAAIAGANGADWLSNNQLLYAPLEGGLTILDLSAGNQQIEILSNVDTYFSPSVTRDGQVVAFTGEREAANLLQIDIDNNQVGTATPIGSTSINLTGTQWAPGGFLLTAFRGGAIALVNPINASGFTLPVTSASAYGWGPEYPPLIANQPLPENAYFLATDTDGIQQVWVLPVDGSRAEPITSASLDITEYALAPDGQQIAYVSNSMLWLDLISDDDDPLDLIELGINADVSPAWSADSSLIYYRDEQTDVSGIWQVNTVAEASIFLADTEDIRYSDPNPALGAGVMLVKQNEDVAQVALASGEVTPLDIIGDGTWETGTQFIVFGEAETASLSGNGLYLSDANSPDALSLILPLLGSFELFDYGLVDGTVRMLVKNQVPGDVRLLDIPLEGGQAVLQGSAGHMVNPRLSPDGSIVLGQRSPEGALLLYDVATNTTRQIDIAPPISQVRWQ